MIRFHGLASSRPPYRPQRNTSPQAVMKDRHSRSGVTQKFETARKSGAGAHNWGSFAKEGEYEFAAGQDASAEALADGNENGVFDMDEGQAQVQVPLPKKADAEDMVSVSDGDGVSVGGGPGTSPSESMSSLESAGRVNGGAGQRRMSNVTEEERERARTYREGMKKKQGSECAVGLLGLPLLPHHLGLQAAQRSPLIVPGVDLAGIARTSYGIAQSPPTTYNLATSPTKSKTYVRW